jgi:hypothetical protein
MFRMLKMEEFIEKEKAKNPDYCGKVLDKS